MIVVFDLGIGQGGFFDHRPHHRLGTAIEQSVVEELQQLAHDLRLGREAHGGVGIGPVADNPQALELVALHADPVLREIAAFLAEFDDRHLVLVLALGAVLFLDLPFDGQAVTVPAGHVRRIKAHHLAGAHDHVLEDLVERMADVQVAVGVGRAVVQDEFLTALAIGAQTVPQLGLGPAIQNFRLKIRQSGTHRKFCLGQIDGIFVIDALWRFSAHRFQTLCLKSIEGGLGSKGSTEPSGGRSNSKPIPTPASPAPRGPGR